MIISEQLVKDSNLASSGTYLSEKESGRGGFYVVKDYKNYRDMKSIREIMKNKSDKMNHGIKSLNQKMDKLIEQIQKKINELPYKRRTILVIYLLLTS